MIDYDPIVVLDFDDDSDERLQETQQRIEKTLKKRIELRRLQLCREAIDMGNEKLSALAVAMMRWYYYTTPIEKIDLNYDLPCEVEKLGYYLAQCGVGRDAIFGKFFEDEKLEEMRRRILNEYDTSSYIFATTHYDECSNGRFFRRS